MKKYFVYDIESVGFETFDTAEERDAEANARIQDYLDDGWSEDVVNVCVGEVTHQATETDRVDRPPQEEIDENGEDGEGNNWRHDFDYICNYALLPIV
jgi:hypothetical protein